MKFSRSGRRLLLATVLAASLAAAADSPLPRIELKAGPHSFDVEVAATPAQRARGLMGRTQLAEGAGMLFVFEETDRHCFWMKDTALPLSIAFVADDGSIVSIDDMQPYALDHHCPSEPVRFALEVEQGGFSDKGIRPGMRLAGEPFSRP